MRVSVKKLTLGVGSYLGVIGAGYWWALSKREEAAKEDLASASEDAQGRPKAFSEEERLSVFGKGAGSYDKEIGTDETVMGLNLLRRWLLAKARGAVLEVAGGTGRNLDYLVPGQGGVASFTVVDLCQGMVAQLEAKLKQRCVNACVFMRGSVVLFCGGSLLRPSAVCFACMSIASRCWPFIHNTAGDERTWCSGSWTSSG